MKILMTILMVQTLTNASFAVASTLAECQALSGHRVILSSTNDGKIKLSSVLLGRVVQTIEGLECVAGVEANETLVCTKGNDERILKFKTDAEGNVELKEVEEDSTPDGLNLQSLICSDLTKAIN